MPIDLRFGMVLRGIVYGNEIMNFFLKFIYTHILQELEVVINLMASNLFNHYRLNGNVVGFE